jgi:hypothetical protein
MAQAMIGKIVMEAVISELVSSAMKDSDTGGDSSSDLFSSDSDNKDPYRYSKITNYTIFTPSVPELQM